MSNKDVTIVVAPDKIILKNNYYYVKSPNSNEYRKCTKERMDQLIERFGSVEEVAEKYPARKTSGENIITIEDIQGTEEENKPPIKIRVFEEKEIKRSSIQDLTQNSCINPLWFLDNGRSCYKCKYLDECVIRKINKYSTK